MRIGIDATNIRAGGGLNHLSELLRAARPARHGVESVIVWGVPATLDRLPEWSWLERVAVPEPRAAFPGKLFWRQRWLTRSALERCDVLFVPGGTYLGSFRPFVAMSQ